MLLGAFLVGSATTSNLLCAGVQLLPLSWIRVREKPVVGQQLISGVGEHCKRARGLEPWVQDVTSCSKELAGVGVIWRCS